MKRYKEYIIKTNPFIPDIISGLLWGLKISGVNEENDLLKIFTDYDSTITKDEINTLLQKAVDENIISSFSVEEYSYEYKNWNQEWEKGINVIELSDLIAIKPSFKDYENKQNKIVITIDPKMSFGTGEHETTKLVIQLLEKHLKKGGKVLDVGTGTGILAIAAVKLGAESVIAIDNDDWCIENAEENSVLNNVNKKIKIKLSEIKDIEEKDFDLIVANIQKNILNEIAYEISNRLNKKGIVILSGLLVEDEKDIIKAYENLKIIDNRKMGEWLALVFQKI